MNTKEYSICFRDFEERDIDFVLKCKNDDSLWYIPKVYL